MATQSYRDSVVAYEAGQLSDEISSAKEDLLERVELRFDGIRTDIEATFTALDSKVKNLGGKLPTSNSRL